MAKFHGAVGFVETTETEPGIWEPMTVERKYRGEFVRNSGKFQVSNKINDDVKVSNEISIVADPYATNNFLNIRYVECMGTRWDVSSVEVKYPRLILTMGGVYNGKQATTA